MTIYQRAQLLKSLQKLDWEMRLRHYAPVFESDEPAEHDDPRDAEQFFLSEQCPSDRTIR